MLIRKGKGGASRGAAVGALFPVPLELRFEPPQIRLALLRQLPKGGDRPRIGGMRGKLAALGHAGTYTPDRLDARSARIGFA